jgi:hypothetical protein
MQKSIDKKKTTPRRDPLFKNRDLPIENGEHKRLKIRFRNLKTFLGMYLEDGTVLVHSKLTRTCGIETLVHEMLHALFPMLNEKSVNYGAASLMYALDVYGFLNANDSNEHMKTTDCKNCSRQYKLMIPGKRRKNRPRCQQRRWKS